MTVTANFMTADGEKHTVTVSPGLTLMEAAVSNMVPGIEAECGGALACATCHVFIDPTWLSKTPAKSDGEIGMLEFAAGVQENSRLSCQIKLTEELDDIVVHIPSTQY
ncbi:2Fe-2S ferredoxin [Sulfitobacter sp. EhC04]|uniref:2Fe-2S iron-sulfur cluster-binding protein n=1 Tax=Sulfitobacter sp. EhC04 TaxID=1849168 RepID=UPI0007F3C815|nr:2Fe-2S iron-sulfur cluster-binding protein [Sulfitobacter sp. EhC04]OAN75715.1 2Fe-2S ferredoxin [Sulfitobacter sp. EhC04]